MRLVQTILVAALSAVTAAPAVAHADLNADIKTQAARSLDLMMQNISRPDAARGSVIAAPSHNDPNYYFYWVRDGALTMDAIERLYVATKSNHYRQLLFDYVAFSRQNQLTSNKSGTFANGGLGEPKFNADGSAFDGEWGRPQNDGPGLRAVTLIHFAKDLLAEGQVNYVRSTLYDSAIPTNSVIKADLEYVAYHWHDLGFDLWEETRGHHFYTLMAQRRSMIEGAALADQLGDGGAATYYRTQAQAMTMELQKYWSSDRNSLLETRDQTFGVTKSGVDIATILGSVHGETDDGYMAPYSDVVLASATVLIDAFNKIYDINKLGDGMAPSIGRYPEDVYNGSTNNNEGNPWFLTTIIFAEVCYKTRLHFEQTQTVTVTQLNRPFLSYALLSAGRGDVPLEVGKNFNVKDQNYSIVLDALSHYGDQFFKTVLKHTGSDGSMSEQFSRHNGYMLSAPNLSWSHGSFLTATFARDRQ